VPWAVDVGVVAGLGLVFESGGVDGDASRLFLRGLINFGVFYVLGLLLGSKILGYGRGESGFAVVDVTDSTN
jgi:hypothetical protein